MIGLGLQRNTFDFRGQQIDRPSSMLRHNVGTIAWKEIDDGRKIEHDVSVAWTAKNHALGLE
jgi:hypothetical protein